MRRLLLFFTLVFASIPLQAQTFPDRHGLGVVDAANVIPDDQERELNNRIVAWDKSTGNEFVVATIPSLQGYDIKDYGYKLGRYWKLGKDASSSERRGLIFLYAPNDKKARIEVGFGLEPVITDAVSSSIIHDIVIPHAKKADHVGAITGASDVLIEAATPKRDDTPQSLVSNKVYKPASDGSILFLLLAVIIAAGCFGYIWMMFRRQKQESEESEQEFMRTMEDIQKPTYTPAPASELYPNDLSVPLDKVERKSRSYRYLNPSPLPRYTPFPKPSNRRGSTLEDMVPPKAAGRIPPPPPKRVAPPPPPSPSRQEDDDSFGSGFGTGAIFGSGFGSDDSSSRNSGWGSSDDSSSSSSDTFGSGGSDMGFGGGGSDGSWD